MKYRRKERWSFFQHWHYEKHLDSLRFLPFAVSGIFNHAGVLTVVCALIFRSVSAPSCTSHFLLQGCFPVTTRTPILGWCSGERSAKEILKRARVLASCINWWCFLSSLGSGPCLKGWLKLWSGALVWKFTHAWARKPLYRHCHPAEDPNLAQLLWVPVPWKKAGGSPSLGECSHLPVEKGDWKWILRALHHFQHLPKSFPTPKLLLWSTSIPVLSRHSSLLWKGVV